MTLDKIKLNQPVKVCKVYTDLFQQNCSIRFIPGAEIALERLPSKNGLLYIVLMVFI